MQAKKEGNTQVEVQLEAALRAAMQAKNATLRPEIQLLNILIGTEAAADRAQVRLESCGGRRGARNG